jgi:hypothetical protein
MCHRRLRRVVWKKLFAKLQTKYSMLNTEYAQHSKIQVQIHKGCTQVNVSNKRSWCGVAFSHDGYVEGYNVE